LFAIKSALAAGLSWEVASLLLGAQAGSLAVVSAIIIVQTTNWQTVRKGIERVLGVIIGVSLAVLVAHFAGLNIVTITLMIFCAQIIGMVVQKRGQYLATQIPISAALALVLGVGGGNYPLLRILGAVVGALVGTAVSLLLSPPIYLSRMRATLAELLTHLADGMPELANALAARLDEQARREVYSHMQALEQQVHATQEALSLALDSARLNPWARSARRLIIDYPDVLLTLDRLARQMRRIAYTLTEPEPSWPELVQKQEWAVNYARLLEELGSILLSAAAFLRLPATSVGSNLADREALRSRIEHARQQLQVWQGQLAQDVKQQGASQPLNADSPFIDAGVRLAVRGAILTDLRRMLDEVHDVVEMLSLPALGVQAEESAVQ
jgi:uncharacterized membrane protein YgaE (UPF0421/DUF939 family)